MNIEEKRMRLLGLLDRAAARSARWNQHVGGGVWRKVARVLFSFGIYSRHLKARACCFAHRNATIQTFWGYKLLLPPSDSNAFPICVLGTLGREKEDKVARFLIRSLQPSDVLYDIGASFGFYTFLGSEFITDGEIHAFEPLPSAFHFLKHNIRKSLPCVLNRCVLSDKEGVVPFYTSIISSGSSTMIQGVPQASGWVPDNQIEVVSTTVDSYIRTHRAPTILKIDAEGAEYAIMKGGAAFFQREHPTIIMEIWEEERGKQFSLPAIQKLCALGYKPYRITSEGFLHEARDAFSLIGKTFDNVVFRK